MKGLRSIPVVLFLFICFGVTSEAASINLPSTLAILQDLFAFTNGERWDTSTNWNTQEYCSFHGVVCLCFPITGTPNCANTVVQLELVSNNLQGSLPPSLGNLTSLGSINMKNNSLRGNIPLSFKQLVNLQFLDLSVNLLDGSVDINGLISLASMNLSNNLFTGDLSGFSFLPNILSFDIGYNHFDGTLLPLTNLTTVKSLVVFYNALNGPIPDEIVQFKDIIKLDMHSNLLRGELPSSLFSDFPHLNYLDVSVNVLKGALPSDTSRSNLTYFNCAFNFLTGEIPDGFWNNRNLSYALIYANFFQGTLSPAISNATSLSLLVTVSNQFSGPIPSTLSNCKFLYYLDLSFSGFSGEIPESLGDIPFLTYLNLEHNNLEGSFPVNFGRLQYLASLNVKGNQLEGTVPSTIGKCISLQSLTLSYNNFTGAILESLLNLTLLQKLDLSYNNFGGSIPPNINQLTDLSYLNIRMNDYQGAIPESMDSMVGLKFIDLSHNQFSEYPLGIFSGIKDLVYFDVSYNLLGGRHAIMTGRDGEVNMPVLEYLDLSHNRFSILVHFSIANLNKMKYYDISANGMSGVFGPIVQTAAIQYANLSYNRLSGFLGEQGSSILPNLLVLDVSNNEFTNGLSPNIGVGVPQMEVINFSNNKIEGPFPYAMSNLKRLKSMDASNNMISGTIPDYIGEISTLQSLKLNGNVMHGEINNLVNLADLQVLDLSNCNFSGLLPNRIDQLGNLVSLRLSGNQFYGKIPEEVQNLRNLAELRLDGNQFEGSIPLLHSDPFIVDVSNNNFDGDLNWLDLSISLKYLNVRNNFFSGQVPSLEFRRKLEYFDLSQNRFNGSVPSLVGTNSIQYLNLSFNEFSGTVPSIQSPLQVVDFRNNHLSKVPSISVSEGTAFCSFEENSLECPVDWMAYTFCRISCSASDRSQSNVRIRIEGDLETFQPSSFLTSIAFVLNVTQSRLKIIGTFAGSVVVDMTVDPPPESAVNEGSAKTVIEQLVQLQMNNPSVFTSVGIRVLNVTSPIPPTDDTFVISNTAIIGIAIGIAALVLLLVIVIAMVLVLRARRIRYKDLNQLSMIDFSQINLGAAKKSIIDYDEISNLSLVGSGAYGIVSKGNWRQLTVALKQIRAEKVNERQLKDFLQEVAILQGLRPHPNVVLFLGMTFPPQPLGIVTEFCEGGSLALYLKTNTDVSAEKKFGFIQGIAQGMLHLHMEKIIHRDLAARNILLTNHLVPKVSDFGLSREQIEDSGQTQSEIGPLKWMSPEAIEKLLYSVKSDVWSFGVVIWEILEGKEPFEGVPPLEAAIQVTTRGVRLKIPEDADPKLKKLMTDCWSINPEDRPDFLRICKILGCQPGNRGSVIQQAFVRGVPLTEDKLGQNPSGEYVSRLRPSDPAELDRKDSSTSTASNVSRLRMSPNGSNALDPNLKRADSAAKMEELYGEYLSKKGSQSPEPNKPSKLNESYGEYVSKPRPFAKPVGEDTHYVSYIAGSPPKQSTEEEGKSLNTSYGEYISRPRPFAKPVGEDTHYVSYAKPSGDEDRERSTTNTSYGEYVSRPRPAKSTPDTPSSPNEKASYGEYVSRPRPSDPEEMEKSAQGTNYGEYVSRPRPFANQISKDNNSINTENVVLDIGKRPTSPPPNPPRPPRGDR